MSALFTALLEGESKASLASMVCTLRDEKRDLLEALKLLLAHPMRVVALNTARIAIEKATGKKEATNGR
jgi:hypothetical protein